MQLKAPLALRSLGLRVIPQETAAPLGGDRGSEPNPFCPPASTFVFYAAAVRDLAGKGAQPDLHRQKAAPPARKRRRGRAGGSPCPKTLPLCPFPFLLLSPPCPLHGQPLRRQGAPGTAAAPGGGQGEGIGPGPTPVPAPGVVGRDPSPPRPPPGCPGLPLKLEATSRVPARQGGGSRPPESLGNV